jgi:type VI secretion system protein ImpE
MTAAAAAREALARGDLDAAQARLVEAVKAAPGDASLRAFLWQLSCVGGQWDRAAKQLGVLAELKPEALDLVGDYRAAIAAEAERRRVFAGEAAPAVFGGARDWTDKLVEALAREAAGESARAAELRAEALDLAPAEAGEIDGDRFDWCADADTRLGPVVETVMNGAYRWLPMSEIASLEITPPGDLRDLVWTVAILTVPQGGEWPVFIPTRYPGAEDDPNPAIRLARRTEFRDLADGHVAGVGQRLIAHSGGDVPLMEMRSLRFDRAAPDADAPENGAPDDDPAAG